MVAWHQHRPHAVQEAMWEAAHSGTRFIFAAAGRGSGKTELARRFLALNLLKPKPWTDPRYFYAAPTRDQAKRIAWDKLKALIPKYWLAQPPAETSLTIRTKWGAELWVVGMDKPQRIEGDQWDGGVLDESCDLQPKIFDLNVAPALMHRDGWCWRIGVPKRTGPSAAEFRAAFEKALTGEDLDSAAFGWSAETVLSDDQLSFARTHLSSRDYDEQIGGVFQNVGGGIYYAFERSYNVRPCAYVPTLPLIITCDFNIDPMAWVIMQDHITHREVIDELWERDCHTLEALEIVYQRYRHHSAAIRFYGDASSSRRDTSASESDYNQICEHKGFKALDTAVHFPAGNPPVLDRHAAVNAQLCNAVGMRQLFVDPSCVHLIDDLEVAYYKPGTHEPAKGGDRLHITDAIGYFLESLFPVTVELDWATQEVGAHRFGEG